MQKKSQKIPNINLTQKVRQSTKCNKQKIKFKMQIKMQIKMQKTIYSIVGKIFTDNLAANYSH